MKKLLLLVSFATLAASSAYAKSTHAKEAAPAADPYVVTSYGQVVGRDPDPNVRLMLLKDGGLLGD